MCIKIISRNFVSKSMIFSWSAKRIFQYVCSQLYRSGSFNSSGMGSNYDPADDVYSDVSLEDVMDLSHKVSKIYDVYVIVLLIFKSDARVSVNEFPPFHISSSQAVNHSRLKHKRVMRHEQSRSAKIRSSIFERRPRQWG